MRVPADVTGSLHSSRVADTGVGDLAAVQSAASTRALHAAQAVARVPWPIAAARALETAAEALRCSREVRRGPARLDPRERAARLSWACERLSRRMRLEVGMRGPVPRDPCIIVANHVSYLDPLAIGAAVPVGAIAKSEIMGWPGVGKAVGDLGIVFVRRGCARSGAVALRQMIRLLAAGVPVLVFPEGTTTTGRDVLPFSRGAFGIARIARVPVVPVTLRYDSGEIAWVGDDSLLPHALKLHRRRRIRAELIFGPGLQPLAFADAASLAEATRTCIRSMLLP